jgi:hypothetical protein
MDVRLRTRLHPPRACLLALAFACAVAGLGCGPSRQLPPDFARPVSLLSGGAFPVSSARLTAARRAARAFAVTYLDAIRGHPPAPGSPASRALLARLSALAASPEARASGAASHLMEVTLIPRGPRRIAASLAFAQPGSPPFLIDLTLALHGGRWLAVRLPAS